VHDADRRVQQVGESMQDKTHRLLDSSATPLGSFRASTTDDIIEAVHYWTSPDRSPAARVRSATMASRLVRRFAVEIAVNNLWANDMSWALAELNASLRKVWLKVDGRDGAENAEAALRGEVEEYFNNPRCEKEPEVESFLATATKWMSLEDDDAASRAGGILMYLTECLEIGENDLQQRQQITSLFHLVHQSLENSDSHQLSIIEERMNQLRGEGWDGMGEQRSTSPGSTATSDISDDIEIEDSLKDKSTNITDSTDAAPCKKVEAIPDPRSLFFNFTKTFSVMNVDRAKVEKAEEALNEMIESIKRYSASGNDLNWVKRCFDVVIKAHRSVREKDVVERIGTLIDTMEEIGIKETGYATRTYLHVVASGKHQESSIDVSKAEGIFQRFMMSYKKGETGTDKPDTHMFINMMEILVKEGRMDMLTRVLDIHDEMKEQGLRLDGSRRHDYVLIACAKGKIVNESVRLRGLQYVTDLLIELQEDDSAKFDNVSRMMNYGFAVHSLRKLLPGKDDSERRTKLIDSAFECCCRDGVLSAKNIKVFNKEKDKIKKEWSRNVLF